MEITTTAHLETYLRQHPLPHTALHPLPGGMGNFVWRVQLPPPATPPTLILKHAEPYLAANRAYPFPTERMHFEHAALTQLRPLLLRALPRDDQPNPDRGIDVLIPEVISYDPTNYVLALEDAGPTTLKAAYTDPALAIHPLGRALAAWLADLHLRTRNLHFDIGDNNVARSVSRYSYDHLVEALGRYGFDEALGRRVDGKYGSLLAGDDEAVCHGDFWPGNVLLSSVGGRSSSSLPGQEQPQQQQQQRKVTVIDWEGCRRGNPATDLGQFAAEAYLLDRFRGGRGLIPSFLGGYVEAVGARGEGVDWERVAVHMGVHLVFWTGTVGWGTEAEEADVVRLGVRMLEGVEAGEWVGGEAWLRGLVG